VSPRNLHAGIPRYIMLMQSLLKKTKPSHPDHDDLCSALDKLETLATHINDSKRLAERSLMMIGIQRMVKRCPNIVAPTREIPLLSQRQTHACAMCWPLFLGCTWPL